MLLLTRVCMFIVLSVVSAQAAHAQVTTTSSTTKPAVCSVVGEHSSGEKSADVSAIQAFLVSRGYILAQSGEFDAATVAVLKQFQTLYTVDILTMQGLTAAPGVWDIYTAMKARDLVCGATVVPVTQTTALPTPATTPATTNPATSTTQTVSGTITSSYNSVPISTSTVQTSPALLSAGNMPQPTQPTGSVIPERSAFTLGAASLTATTTATSTVTANVSTEPLVCLAMTIEPGVKGDSDVKNIQKWLISQGYTKVEATGNYGVYTQRAIKHFQLEYASEILEPAGLSKATGTWGEYTAKKASSMGLCDYDEADDVAAVAQETKVAASHSVLEDVYPGVCLPRVIDPDTGEEKGNARDVKIIQRFLISRGYKKVEATGYYGTLTKRAIAHFQQENAADILEPAGLSQPTGTWGIRTAIKASELGLCTFK